MPEANKGSNIPGAARAEWRARTSRLAPVVDGVDYYRFLRDALIRARRDVLIVGWDLHSEIDLLRGEEAARASRESAWPVRLADLLLRLVQERGDLHIRLLIWRGASLFALERQHWPRMKRPWADHPRLELEWDSDTPRIASQHQKFVVIDDAIAFTGGMDLTSSRWDTHEHAPIDARRRLPGLLPLRGDPYHDLMLAVDGDAARTLGMWGRERWRRATGKTLRPPPEDLRTDPWPDDLEPMLCDRHVYFALTQPDFGGRPEKRQVQETFLDQITAAQDCIYIETQYLTAQPIVEALCERLRENTGPEVVLILPPGCPGSIQAMSMDPRRDELLDRLRDADRDGRFAVYWATLRGGSTEDIFHNSVYIHAKTMVIDDRLVRIGSANLNNRSMGLDTELDVFFAVDDADETGITAVALYRRRLLSYLLHTDTKTIAAAEKNAGSLIGAIASLRGGEKTLYPFEHRAETLDTGIALPVELADPDHPLTDEDAERVLAAMWSGKNMSQNVREAFNDAVAAARHRRRGVTTVLAVLIGATAWTFLSFAGLVEPDMPRDVLDIVRTHPAGVACVAIGVVLLGSAGVPAGLLIAATAALVDLAHAIPICAGGLLLSASIHYALGRFVPGLARRMTSKGLVREVTDRLAGGGILSVALARNMPIAPFMEVSAACARAGILSARYLAGTAIGMLPGTLLLLLTGRVLRELIVDPGMGWLVALFGVVATLPIVAFLFDMLLRILDKRGFRALDELTARGH